MNIAGGTPGGVAPNPSDWISNSWYNGELANYPAYGVASPDMTNFESWGHMSQVVWPTTEQIGCGVSDCGGSWFAACVYNPPGNYEGDFQVIGAPLAQPTVCGNDGC